MMVFRLYKDNRQEVKSTLAVEQDAKQLEEINFDINGNRVGLNLEDSDLCGCEELCEWSATSWGSVAQLCEYIFQDGMVSFVKWQVQHQKISYRQQPEPVQPRALRFKAVILAAEAIKDQMILIWIKSSNLPSFSILYRFKMKTWSSVWNRFNKKFKAFSDIYIYILIILLYSE